MAAVRPWGVDLPKLIAAIAICQVVGNLGTVFTLPALPGWYASLSKPAFTPPNWVFAPIWLILYTLMGVALYLLWSRWAAIEKRARSRALYAFSAQLALNPVWSFLFFGLRSPAYGLVGIALLWIASLAAVIELRKASGAAALAMLPYVCWVSFAAALNLAIALLNAGP